jgi:hypothetical protein
LIHKRNISATLKKDEKKEKDIYYLEKKLEKRFDKIDDNIEEMKISINKLKDITKNYYPIYLKDLLLVKLMNMKMKKKLIFPIKMIIIILLVRKKTAILGQINTNIKIINKNNTFQKVNDYKKILLLINL